MFTFELMTEADRREAAAIDRRRAFEEERRKRIFNPRMRLIGNDYEALEKQIEEKRKRDAEERKRNETFETHLLKCDQIAVAMETKEREERRKLQAEVENFRKHYQKYEDRREYDLNDPNYMKKSLPARLHDEDPRIGMASVQKFEGEDAASSTLSKIQKEELKSWLEQQMDERSAADKQQKESDNAYKTAIIARDQRAIELDRLERDCRKKLEQACYSYNKALAVERECYKDQQKKREKEDNLAQMYNTMTSDMMTENPDVSISNLGSNRRIGYLYKGMNKQELEAFRKAQLDQMEDNKKRKSDEKRFEREWDNFANGTQRTVAILDIQQERKSKEREKAMAEENKKLAVDQKNQKEFMEKIVYNNRPTAEFYEQFNKGTR